MDVVLSLPLFLVQDNVRVTVVEFSVSLRGLLDWLELLDPVDLNWLFASLLEESLSLLTQLPDVVFKVFSVESVVLCFNHCCDRFDCVLDKSLSVLDLMGCY